MNNFVSGGLALALFGFSTALLARPIDPTQSRIDFSGTQMGAQVDGQFHRFGGDIRFEPADPAHGSAHITIDLGSIDLASEESEDEIKGKHWFNIPLFPQAVFDSDQIRPLGGARFVAIGKLKIKGVAKTIQVPLQISGSLDHPTYRGQFVLKRTDFGVGDGEWTATDSVADEVTVRFQLTANP